MPKRPPPGEGRGALSCGSCRGQAETRATTRKPAATASAPANVLGAPPAATPVCCQLATLPTAPVGVPRPNGTPLIERAVAAAVAASCSPPMAYQPAPSASGV